MAVKVRKIIVGYIFSMFDYRMFYILLTWHTNDVPSNEQRKLREKNSQNQTEVVKFILTKRKLQHKRLTMRFSAFTIRCDS